MIEVDGIILVLSCQKHKNTRLSKYKLSQKEYSGWKVIYVIGDVSINTDYLLEDNFMYIKCEDSYIHLLKKLGLSIKYLYKIFNIKEGVLRCGDDLVFNEEKLVNFLKSEKYDYYGYHYEKRDCIMNSEQLKKIIDDKFMLKYYNEHPEDFEKEFHGLKGKDISKYTKRPDIRICACGVIYFISNKSCKIIVDHMDKIYYDVFHFDELTKSYPYTIEDCGIGFIMYINNIPFTHNDIFFSNYIENVDNKICYHSNEFK